MAKPEVKMPYAVFIIKPDGSITKTLQPKTPTYTQLRDAVAGYIETIPHFVKLEHEGETFSRGVAYCNEEGKIRGLPHNETASKLWRASLTGDFDHNRTQLNGDVIFHAKVATGSVADNRKTIASGDKSPKEKREE
jgi:hypothetical protein